MANPFSYKHIMYGIAGIALGILLGYFLGVALMVLGISSAGYNYNATAAMRFSYQFSTFPLSFTMLGAFIGLFVGLIYSHEKEEKEEKEKQQVVVVQAPQK